MAKTSRPTWVGVRREERRTQRQIKARGKSVGMREKRDYQGILLHERILKGKERGQGKRWRRGYVCVREKSGKKGAEKGKGKEGVIG